VKPYELINQLVQRAGGEGPVARAMGDEKFQGTLWKFCHGRTLNPARATAERIAKHFKLPVEALYSERVAAEWATAVLADFGEAQQASEFHPHKGGAPSAGIPLPAHAVSHLPFNDPPTFKWEDLLTIDPSDLPERFSVALPDNAMAPFARAGRIVWFRRATAVLKSGVCVLVKDAKGGLYFRRYRSYTADHWQAAPINESDFLPLDSEAHGLSLLAVMTHLESDGSEF